MNKENEAEHAREAELDAARADNEEARSSICDDCLARGDCEKTLRSARSLSCLDYKPENPNDDKCERCGLQENKAVICENCAYGEDCRLEPESCGNFRDKPELVFEELRRPNIAEVIDAVLRGAKLKRGSEADCEALNAVCVDTAVVERELKKRKQPATTLSLEDYCPNCVYFRGCPMKKTYKWCSKYKEAMKPAVFKANRLNTRRW